MSRSIRMTLLKRTIRFSIFALFFVLPLSIIKAQGYGDRSRAAGTGGVNSIQGRINFPSDQPATSLRVRLESTNSATLTTISNTQGIFYFGSLEPGQYTIIVETGNEYEPVRESLSIDREIVGVELARNFNLMVDLRPKRVRKELAGVTNASLANVPKPAMEQFRKAIEAINKNDNKLALEKLNEAIRLYPTFAEAHSELGALYLRNGELNKAEQSLQKALQINEKNPTAQLNYGIVLLNQRKMYEAEKQLEKAVLADESAVAPHIYLGIALLGLEYPDYAEKEFLKAISLKDDEKSAQAHRYLGGIYWKKGSYKLAVEHLEKYLKAVPNATDTAKVQATIKELQGKIK